MGGLIPAEASGGGLAVTEKMPTGWRFPGCGRVAIAGRW